MNQRYGQLFIIAILGMILFGTLYNRSQATSSQPKALSSHDVSIQKGEPEATTVVKINPNDLVDALYIASEQKQQKYASKLEKYKIKGVTIKDKDKIDQAHVKILYIDRDQLDSVDGAWLSKKYIDGVLIVGVDVNVSEFARIISVNGDNPLVNNTIPDYPITDNQIIMTFISNPRFTDGIQYGTTSMPVPEFDYIVAYVTDEYQRNFKSHESK